MSNKVYIFIYNTNVNYNQQSNTAPISSRAAVNTATPSITAAAS